MSLSIFPLSINEAFFICPYSSAITMWLVIFINHACVIPSHTIIKSLNFDTIDFFIGDLIGNLFEGIILILAINIVNIQWP
jgi:hypothetical protein